MVAEVYRSFQRAIAGLEELVQHSGLDPLALLYSKSIVMANSMTDQRVGVHEGSSDNTSGMSNLSNSRNHPSSPRNLQVYFPTLNFMDSNRHEPSSGPVGIFLTRRGSIGGRAMLCAATKGERSCVRIWY